MCRKKLLEPNSLQARFFFLAAKSFIVSMWPRAQERARVVKELPSGCRQGDGQAEALSPGGAEAPSRV